uniref:Uncharacterized protein n=1 Tax=Romanomermis culicivorax TaxID=13658 RepID=A0A915HJ88_ROMCU
MKMPEMLETFNILSCKFTASTPNNLRIVSDTYRDRILREKFLLNTYKNKCTKTIKYVQHILKGQGRIFKDVWKF